MGHKAGATIIIPDQLYLDHEPLLWFQPMTFMANLIMQSPEGIDCTLHVDIESGHLITVRFKAEGHRMTFEDHSQLFECEITGPADLSEHATGSASKTPDGRILLKLYHHTSDATAPLIRSSGHLRLSRWNIQGNRELANVGYAYFTSLPHIRTEEDLKAIAMASDVFIYFMRDNFDPPVLRPQDLRSLPNDILALEVYRESTQNRTATLEFWVDAAFLAPQHILKHSLHGNPVYYEICGPKIHRVGMEPGLTLPFDAAMVIDGGQLKRFDYAIVGDARFIPGLYAPYNEENTAYMHKVHVDYEGADLLTYWMTHTNRDIFTGLTPELQSLSPPPDRGGSPTGTA